MHGPSEIIVAQLQIGRLDRSHPIREATLRHS